MAANAAGSPAGRLSRKAGCTTASASSPALFGASLTDSFSASRLAASDPVTATRISTTAAPTTIEAITRRRLTGAGSAADGLDPSTRVVHAGRSAAGGGAGRGPGPQDRALSPGGGRPH